MVMGVLDPQVEYLGRAATGTQIEKGRTGKGKWGLVCVQVLRPRERKAVNP